MKPIGPLMREHRRIERMIALLAREIERLKEDSAVDVRFIESAVDFFRTYADRTHHGKEEDILFRELAKKSLTDELRKTMNELIEEHKTGRNIVSRLVLAKDSGAGSQQVRELFGFLVDFYPKHIEKEDKHFFFPVLDYFSDEEQQSMLEEFDEFDKSLIHEKYEKVVSELEAARIKTP